MIEHVAGRFTPSGVVAVDADGEDADGDVRDVIVRLLDGTGDEIARTAGDLRPSGTAFSVLATARGAALARVRAAAVRAQDATRLSSAETVAF